MNAVGIKKIIYCDTTKVSADLTKALAKALVEDAGNKSISNVHGDTWQLEESEASVTSYKNALTDKTYRNEIQMGDINASFTIGEYDFETKAALLGGSVVTDGAETPKNIGWKRASGKVKIYKTLMCLTEDDVWFIFPKCQVIARNASTDKAVGLAVKGMVIEPDASGVSSEYNFDASES